MPVWKRSPNESVGHHLLVRGDPSAAASTPDVEGVRLRKRRAARAIKLGQPVDEADREAGLEWAKLRMISTRFTWNPALLLGQFAILFIGVLTIFAGVTRIVFLVFVLIDAALIGCGLVVQRRTRRWWEENRVGTRYDDL